MTLEEITGWTETENHLYSSSQITLLCLVWTIYVLFGSEHEWSRKQKRIFQCLCHCLQNTTGATCKASRSFAVVLLITPLFSEITPWAGFTTPRLFCVKKKSECRQSDQMSNVHKWATKTCFFNLLISLRIQNQLQQPSYDNGCMACMCVCV